MDGEARLPLNDYQRGVLAGLKIGAPTVARVYAAICETPGMAQADVRRASRDMTGAFTGRVLQLERAHLIRTQLTRRGGRNVRLCYPVEETS